MSEAFVTCLNNHTVFKDLKETLGECHEKTKCSRFITCRNDILYIWNNLKQHVDTVSIKQVLKGADSTGCISYVPSTLYFEVESISVNSTSTLLALYGPSGVSCIKLADRWLLKEKTINVPCFELARKVFFLQHHVLRKLKWHPHSPTDSHIVLLTSDEKIRLYNVLEESLVWEIPLSSRMISRNLPSKVSLGETPVDFDFGLCETTGDKDDLFYPVYIVWGNGDVFSVNTDLEGYLRYKIEGPFRVVPSADDNYGLDASSIAVMDTTPPLIVISTCNGLIYQCLLLPDTECDDNTRLLHVIERIELELGLPLSNTADLNDIISCPISLEKDSFCNYRYFCVHNAGIHSVTLPLVAKLNELGTDNLSLDSDKIQSCTEYLLCTAMSNGVDITCSPILGIAYLDFTKILVLLLNGKLLKIPLTQYDSTSLNKAINESLISIESLKIKNDNDFSNFIDNLLKEKGISSYPLMKLPGDMTKPQDWLEIVRKAISSYRTVLKTHAEVALKIQQKSHVLKSKLNRQMEETSLLNGEKADLRSTAEQIAEKYEEINEKQTELIKRAEKLLLKTECHQDKSLSSNEKKMSNLLEKAKLKIGQLERDISAIQSFHSQYENNVKQTFTEKDVYFGKSTTMLFKNLKFLGVELKQLTERVLLAQETVANCTYKDL